MTTLEKFNRKVIELIHGEPYGDAIKKEREETTKELYSFLSGSYWCSRVWEAWQYNAMTIDDFTEISDDKAWEDIVDNYMPKITIGKVMQALMKKSYKISEAGYEWKQLFTFDSEILDSFFWQLTKPNGQECTSEDQTEETLEKILEILNK